MISCCRAELNISYCVLRESAGCQHNVNVSIRSALLAVFKLIYSANWFISWANLSNWAFRHVFFFSLFIAVKWIHYVSWNKPFNSVLLTGKTWICHVFPYDWEFIKKIQKQNKVSIYFMVAQYETDALSGLSLNCHCWIIRLYPQKFGYLVFFHRLFL